MRQEAACHLRTAADVVAVVGADDAVRDRAVQEPEPARALVAVRIAVPLALLDREARHKRLRVVHLEDAVVGRRRPAAPALQERLVGSVLAVQVDRPVNDVPEVRTLVGAVSDDNLARLLVRREQRGQRFRKVARRRLGRSEWALRILTLLVDIDLGRQRQDHVLARIGARPLAGGVLGPKRNRIRTELGHVKDDLRARRIGDVIAVEVPLERQALGVFTVDKPLQCHRSEPGQHLL